MSGESTRGAIEADVLKSRALGHKRNVLAAGVCLVAIYTLTEIDYKDLSLFGLKMTDGVSHRSAILIALWLLLLYNLVAYGYEAFWDFRLWRDKLTAKQLHNPPQTYFPELRMFFGQAPKDYEAACKGLEIALVQPWKMIEHAGRIEWRPDVQAIEGRYRYALDRRLVIRVRERVWSFIAWDVAVPAAPVLAAVFLMIWDLWPTI
jgi:hypothetical protein